MARAKPAPAKKAAVKKTAAAPVEQAAPESPFESVADAIAAHKAAKAATHEAYLMIAITKKALTHGKRAAKREAMAEKNAALLAKLKARMEKLGGAI